MSMTVSPESAARMACRASGLPDRSLTRLHHHATSVFLLAAESIVVRVSPISQQQNLATAVSLTRWLVAHGFPATEPADAPQPVAYESYAVTFWQHYPQPEHGRPPTGRLGGLLRALHSLPAPPVTLPQYQPLASLKGAVESSTHLGPDAGAWLMERRQELLNAYVGLEFPLGHGHIHGDAYPGNTLWDAQNIRLGDWDEAALGPREIDLANTFQGVRFGRTSAELDDFSRRYGYDIREWPGLPVLVGIRDLHTLGSFIRRADRGDVAAANQLFYRIETLRNMDKQAKWASS
ncbi:aminoglycoside phosphotransferase family protein [Streptomyces scabiei]|uniref:Aminoglycoside phosphotransferase family protein n=2 Tax=Streptomyces TaxID=1883 RepID=A0ABU4N882_9ACTN|nr:MULTISPECIES: aminoglycoside phosphotransferase family protein [Streptomyces]MBP5860509.1 aminoglycoside phosphotransferase family protein [Streptomyces sp. LBUM 1484]MBP5870518.1 aminoglycoside phosphotransferase family protein [Streptomyces sp. LBUM 1485]MBP5879009.1 aminoglycoside phosphotransferase family protein [Streptomyces sp. LBUM 1477]MBP5886939.1 aminoglycoside phosphotransferase family protein [Streptomyces sp. LBUM 1487]MBP5902936.1 aminoglycoside phosphotransferase family prot